MTVAVWASLGETFRCFKDVGMVSCSNGDGNRDLDGIDEIQYKEIVTRAMQAISKLRTVKPITNIQQNKDCISWIAWKCSFVFGTRLDKTHSREFRFGQLRKSYLCKTAASHNR